MKCGSKRGLELLRAAGADMCGGGKSHPRALSAFVTLRITRDEISAEGGRETLLAPEIVEAIILLNTPSSRRVVCPLREHRDRHAQVPTPGQGEWRARVTHITKNVFLTYIREPSIRPKPHTSAGWTSRNSWSRKAGARLGSRQGRRDNHVCFTECLESIWR